MRKWQWPQCCQLSPSRRTSLYWLSCTPCLCLPGLFPGILGRLAGPDDRAIKAGWHSQGLLPPDRQPYNLPRAGDLPCASVLRLRNGCYASGGPALRWRCHVRPGPAGGGAAGYGALRHNRRLHCQCLGPGQASLCCLVSCDEDCSSFRERGGQATAMAARVKSSQ